MLVLSANGSEEKNIIPCYGLYEQEYEEDDVRPVKSTLKVALFYDNGGHLNAEEPDSRRCIDTIHLKTEETHIPSHVDHYVI